MSEPRWITKQQALNMHAEQLATFGGPAGVCNEGALESALARAKTKWAHRETDLAALAAAYAYRLARNHPFVDGNKRAAFMCMMVFLRKNGVEFEPLGPEATVAMVNLAAGEISEDGLARWIRDNWTARDAAKPKKAPSKRAARPAKSSPRRGKTKR